MTPKEVLEMAKEKATGYPSVSRQRAAKNITIPVILLPPGRGEYFVKHTQQH
ncbi:MAG: hypothetical protein JRD49_14615 [Deltaproteobacteria bacterium]|nr:hypothetical protein [Deltaproteobacteria bacterium]